MSVNRKKTSVHRSYVCFAFLTVVLLFTAQSNLYADWVWTRESSWINPADEVPASPENLLAATRKLFAEKKYQAAVEGYELFVHFYYATPEASSALVEMVEALYLVKNYERALEVIAAVLKIKDTPASIIVKVVKTKYEIGRLYLAGEKRSFLGIRYTSSTFGVEILDEIWLRFPGLPYADDALYHVASYYQSEEKYLEAEHIYNRLIDEYAASEWRSHALCQLGICAMARLKGVVYDLKPYDEAESAFRRYKDGYPGGDRRREVIARLKTISETRAEAMWRVANFYLRTKHKNAARHYFQRVLTDFPQTEAAKKSLKAMESL